MFNRIDLTLRPGIAAGLLAALPWALMAAATLAVSRASFAALALAAVPPAFMACRQFCKSGLLLGPGSARRLTLQAGSLQVTLADGRQLAAEVTGDSRVFAGLAVLKLRTPATTLNLPVVILHERFGPFAANTDADGFRRLRVWLRLGQPPPTAGAAGATPRLNHGD